MTGKNIAGRNVNIRFSRRIHHKAMSQNDLSAAGRVRRQATPQGCCQIMPSDDDEMLPMADASASETISVVSNQLLHAEQFNTRPSIARLANVPEVRAPRPDEMLLRELPDCRRVHVARTTGGLLAILGIGFLGGSAYYGLRDYLGRELSGNNAIAIVVERIIDAESNGCPNLKNTRSTASGAGQFLDETWVRLIRAYRPDIARRSEREVLELRRDPELAREITTRLAEQSAAKLRQHGFPVTQGTLYWHILLAPRELWRSFRPRKAQMPPPSWRARMPQAARRARRSPTRTRFFNGSPLLILRAGLIAR